MNRSNWFFSHNTRYLRQKKGLTQEQLAEKANVSVNEVSKVERGLVTPQLTVLDRFANAFGVQSALLLDPHLDKMAEVPCAGRFVDAVALEMDGLTAEEQELVYQLVRDTAQYFHDRRQELSDPDKLVIK